jgi:hypothetical protein
MGKSTKITTIHNSILVIPNAQIRDLSLSLENNEPSQQPPSSQDDEDSSWDAWR